jgi:hypothetical protein
VPAIVFQRQLNAIGGQISINPGRVGLGNGQDLVAGKVCNTDAHDLFSQRNVAIGQGG